MFLMTPNVQTVQSTAVPFNSLPDVYLIGLQCYTNTQFLVNSGIRFVTYFY